MMWLKNENCCIMFLFAFFVSLSNLFLGKTLFISKRLMISLYCSVKRTTKRTCNNGRLYLRTTRFLLHPLLINLFVYNGFIGFESCSGSCFSKDVIANVVYIGNLNSLYHVEKIYIFKYLNKNCDKHQ